MNPRNILSGLICGLHRSNYMRTACPLVALDLSFGYYNCSSCFEVCQVRNEAWCRATGTWEPYWDIFFILRQPNLFGSFSL